MSAAAEVLDRLQAAAETQHAATLATLQLCRTILTESKARGEDDDDWLRMPSPKARCPLSGWSRTSLVRRIEAGDVRKKKISGMAYYAGADVRAYLSKQPTPAA